MFTVDLEFALKSKVESCRELTWGQMEVRTGVTILYTWGEIFTIIFMIIINNKDMSKILQARDLFRLSKVFQMVQMKE